jgi:hypothetical protein
MRQLGTSAGVFKQKNQAGPGINYDETVKS